MIDTSVMKEIRITMITKSNYPYVARRSNKKEKKSIADKIRFNAE